MNGVLAKLSAWAKRLRRAQVQDPVFLFPGQGSQWPGMALELLDESPLFARRMSECAAAFEPYVEWSLFDVLKDHASPLWAYPRFSQPAIFAVEVSLLEVWRSFGVEPGGAIGQSAGEVGAAFAAGAFDLDDAARLSARWGLAQEKGANPGTMAFVLMGGERLEPRMLGLDLKIGGFISPKVSVVTGATEDIEKLLAELAEEDVWGMKIEGAVGGGHRQLSKAGFEQGMRRLAWVTPRAGSVPFYSTLSGDVYDTGRLDADYWLENIGSPVLFERAVRAAIRDGHRTFIDLGPNPVLKVPVEEIGGEQNVVAFGTVRKGKAGLRDMHRALEKARDRGLGSAKLSEFEGATERFEVATVSDGASAGNAASTVTASAGSAGELRERLAPMTEDERLQTVVDLLRVEIAALLEVEPGEIEPSVAFLDLGLESAAVAGLRDRIRRVTGIDLPTAAAFDFPTVEELASHLRARVFGVERQSAPLRAHDASGALEPVAIVGVACRFPGGIANGSDLWAMASEARDGLGPYPDDRDWDPNAYRISEEQRYEGGFLYEAGDFDPRFFGMGPREALATDPQQRLLLEGAWEALQDAGIDPASLRGTSTGVFAGISSQDYFGLLQRLLRPSDAEVEETAGLELVGSLVSVASGRIAYTLGLEGPAVTLDTACSSSLVAMHLAAQALRSGECELALAGGATVLCTPAAFVGLMRQGGLSPGARCKSFDAAADGTVWAEGMGLLALERLSDAKAKGRRILAVIRGSAVNQDGASNGLTAPNGPSQERVIRQALANAGLTPAEVDAVEAHGTGTVLGDPIEAQALLATYGQGRESGPLALGSLKSNIGHAQAAAGVGGVIKMVMALEHEELPQTLHVDEPTPHVDWSAGEIELLTEAREWKRGSRPRRAGVSSFGISGTNAHLILEEPPEQVREQSQEPPAAIPLALSAKSTEALAASASRLGAHIRAEAPDPTDVAHTLLASRASLPHRAVIAGADTDELLEGLDALAAGRGAPGLAEGRAGAHRKVAFVFPGQGSQWAGMAAGLLEQSPVFAESMARCEAALAPHLDFPLAAELRSGQEQWLSRIELVQPALFATMVSLAELWRSFGIEPGAVIGHSQGEIAAAVVAGALSLEEGAKLAALRAQAISSLVGKGAMVSAAASRERIEPLLGDGVELAALNSPGALTLACGAEELPGFLERCEAEGIRAREVAATIPSHCARVEPLEEEVLGLFADLQPQAARIPIYSTLSGEALSGPELDAAYWYRNLREPVRFEQATRALLADGFSALIEQSSHPVLAAALTETAEDAGAKSAVLHTLRRGEGDMRRFATALGAAHCHGLAVDWEPLIGAARPPVRLPSYPFQRSRYWLAAKAGGGDPSSLGQGATSHPFLGASIHLASEEKLLFTGRVSVATHPWLADHAVGGTVLLPGTAFAELALRAGEEVGAEYLKELVLEAPLLLAAEGAVQLQLSAVPAQAEGHFEIAIHSRPEGADELTPWTRHAAGTLAPAEPAPADFDASAWPPPGAEPIEVEQFYDLLAAAGLEYGPAFQGMGAAWRLGEEIYAEVSLDEAQRSEAERFAVHPALLDAALHPAIVAMGGEEGGLRLPFSWSGVQIGAGRGPSELRVRVAVEEGAIALRTATPEGLEVASVRALATRPFERGALAGPSPQGDSLFVLGWQQAELGAEVESEAEAELHRVAPLGAGEDPAQAAHTRTAAALAAIAAHLADEEKAGSRLAILTEGALATDPTESPDPAAAAVAGLVGSARSEHPGRFVLIDSDASAASEALIGAAAAGAGEEGQIALREGLALVARLARAEAPEPDQEGFSLDPERTVLITGGLTGVGALTARHLATRHGARHLLLAGRRGPAAPGAPELCAELAEIGCEAQAVACDVSDKEQLGALLDSIPPEHPLGAVFHSAGAIDDATIDSLTPERLDRVLAPKADAAWHLHELTREAELSAFVLYSSAAGVFGAPGQGNYAAANAFLDALAARRRAEGLTAVSIAWGLWEERSELTAGLGEEDEARMRQRGFAPLSTAEGMESLDRAGSSAESLVVAVPFDLGALRIYARNGLLPPLLTGLVRVAPRRARMGSGAFARRLVSLEASERKALALAEIQGHLAVVLGRPEGEAIDRAASFQELGVDSLSAIELRNRLAQATGVQLEATLVFDRPTPEAVAEYLVEQIEGGGVEAVVRAARGAAEPVAIVGIGCRFPGEVGSAEELWEMLASGTNEIAIFPGDRGWGQSEKNRGGFLHDAADFDPAFFSISPREAVAMDPQQRVLLEGAWETLEDAGIDPSKLQGSSTGVFAGLMHLDYGLGAMTGDHSEVAAFFGTGLPGSVASGRIAYTLGLEGPAVTLDTACSSSLVAIHLAAQALRSGECELALAGGATVMSTPFLFAGMGQQGALAHDGRCKSFAAAADGTGLAEGMGLLALERLSDAKAKGRRILAVIRGSAVNQDGASNGLTAPNGPSQERVIRQALANAGLAPAEVDAVEAHGTGTVLGDPIEAQALLATYGQGRESGPLALGSLKSNIGHAQAAAGVGGVIKMVMALEHEELPQTLHVDEPTPHVDWSAGEIELLTEAREWKRGSRPRRAGVSSFGISGTNAHLILEEPPEQVREQSQEPPAAIPLALSAKSTEALAASASRLGAHIRAEAPDPTDVAHTLLASRASLPHRAVIAGADTDELLEGLDALAAGRSAPNIAAARAQRGKSAWLLSGQGCQRAQMGTELYAAFPVYAQALDRACEALGAEGVEVKAAIFAAPASELSRSLDRTDITQASLFASELALAELLASFGLAPDLLLGHSIGEIAAVHLAGALSLADAAKLVAARGTLMAALPAGGAMASIRAGEEEVEEGLAPFAGSLAIAALNAPASTVVSGEEQALERWLAEREAEGVKAKRLEVSHAFHSHLIEPMLEQLEAVAGTLEFQPFEIPVISNLDGEVLSAERAAEPSYWAAQARSTVRFAAGVAALGEQGAARFLEVGPDAVLTAIAAECLQREEDLALAPTLRREHSEPVSFALALGAMHAAGAEVDWEPLIGAPRPPVRLPSYPFQRSRYWLAAKAGGGDPSSLGQGATSHPFLGASIHLASEGEHLFTGRVSQSSHPWLADHAVGGTVLLPGTAFAELALRAGEEVGAEYLKELVLEAPLLLPEQGAVDLRLSLSAAEGETSELQIHSRAAAEEEELPWTRHAVGTLSREQAPAPDFDASAWPPPGAEPIEVEELYDRLAAAGLEYGPAFQGMGAAWRLGEEIYAEVGIDEEQRSEAERFALHPALLDAAGHAVLLAGPSEALRLPFAFSGVWVGKGLGATDLRVRVRPGGERAEIAIADVKGRPVGAVGGLSMRELDPASLRGRGAGKDLYELRWDPVSPAEAPAPEAELHRLGGPAAGEEAPAAARRLAGEALAATQAFLAAEDSAPRLAILTAGAVAASPGDSPHPALAAAWGLVRSAQAEHPGRFVLLDLDGEASEAELEAALAIAGEPVLALRGGKLLAPRLARVAASEEPGPLPLDPERTVLITGGLSGLGALAARHLAERHGAKRLLLVGRRGAATPGASELVAELAEAGCEAKALACDVSDRGQLQALLETIPAAHPLGAVIHCAGVVDDALLADQGPERIDRVLAPKADAAWHLHELTREAELSAFVLYSSVAGTLESPGQANYAAANAFLDALARGRRAEGLAGTAVAWGPWEEGMAADLGQAGSARRERLGLGDLSEEEGFELLDLVLAKREPALVAVRLLHSGLRRQARAGALSPLLSGLVSVTRKRGEREGSLARKVAAASEEERFGAMLEFVREEVAGILGCPSAESIEPDQAFKDMGFDSLGAVELRNRLALETGVRLDATVVFDYPTSAAVSGHLLDRMDLSPAAEADPEREEIRQLLEAISPARLREAGVLETLQSLSGAALAGGGGSDIDAMDVDELVKRTLEEPATQEAER